MSVTSAPRAVAKLPATVTAIAEQLRAAHAAARPSRIAGAGTWLDAGHPVRGDAARLDVAAARGITEYVPGDLTLTALAGTSLAELQEATRANGQRLVLDPYGTDAGTLGATLATASAGPLAGAYGTPRDNALGLTFVTGTGEIVQGGGRVVKNVAGFDLVRLATGAWGTLGAIVEATVRLHALPAADETYVIDAGDDDQQALAAVAALRALPFTYDAAELLDGTCARRLGAGAAGTAILVRASGTPETVRAMRAALAAAGVARDADPQSWTTLRALEPAGSATVRLSHLPSRRSDLWRAARLLAGAGDGWAHLAVGRNVARVTLPAGASEPGDAFAARIAAALDRLAATFDGTCIAERLPAGAWPTADLVARRQSDVRRRLERGVRTAFDPERLLNPGILGADGGEG